MSVSRFLLMESAGIIRTEMEPITLDEETEFELKDEMDVGMGLGGASGMLLR